MGTKIWEGGGSDSLLSLVGNKWLYTGRNFNSLCCVSTVKRNGGVACFKQIVGVNNMYLNAAFRKIFGKGGRERRVLMSCSRYGYGC